jgi:GT2 family glycosyltransferase
MGVVRRCCPVVSVVIVNYNGGALVSAAVEAVRDSGIPLEIIVADNGSKDGSLDFLRHRFGNTPSVHFIDNGTNLGFARASNLGVEQARGRYILLLNPDCLVYPETLKRVVEAMESRPRAAMAGCLIRNPDGTEQAGSRRSVPTPWRTLVRVFHLNKLFPKSPRFRSFVLTGTPLPKEAVTQEAISGAFMFIRREALEQVGLLDEGYFLHCEDLDWCMRFRQAGWDILFVPNAEAVHYKGYCSRTRPSFVLYHLHKGMIRFYRKFFRHQYPAPLMWAVAAAVWLRFILLASTGSLRRVYAGRASAMVPEPLHSSAEKSPDAPVVWPQERPDASVLAFDQSDPAVTRQLWERSAGERRTMGSSAIGSPIPRRRKSDRE